jgi:divalent metal cation (Fe/Co/Zn/Cd) transporter
MTNEETAVKTYFFSIIGNACLALIKGTAGFGNSYALIADAIESTTDIFCFF